MLRSLRKLLVLIAAVQVFGGHWAVLQSVAWVRMAANFAQTASLPEALEKTFSGEHPCDLCQVVKRGMGEEQKQTERSVISKLDAVLVARLSVPQPREESWDYFEAGAPGAARSLAPPTPPPLV